MFKSRGNECRITVSWDVKMLSYDLTSICTIKTRYAIFIQLSYWLIVKGNRFTKVLHQIRTNIMIYSQWIRFVPIRHVGNDIFVTNKSLPLNCMYDDKSHMNKIVCSRHQNLICVSNSIYFLDSISDDLSFHLSLSLSLSNL